MPPQHHRKDAAKLNSIGVHLLQMHEYESAAVAFAEATEAMAQAVRQESNLSASSLGTSQAIEDDPIFRRSGEHMTGEPETCQDANPKHTYTRECKTEKNEIDNILTNAVGNQQVSMYSKPFHLDSSSCGIKCSSQPRQHSACILFNMALSKQLKGFFGSQVCDLEEALRVYDLVLRMLSPIDNETIFAAAMSSDDDVASKYELKTFLVYLATLNNMIHICVMLNRHADAIGYHEEITRVSEEYNFLLTAISPYGHSSAAAAA